MRLSLSALLIVLLLLTPGCDSDDDGLEAAFFVGTWTLVSIADGSGDRTSELEPLVNDFTTAFAPNGTVTIDIDFTTLAETIGGISDIVVTGTYDVTSQEQLVLSATVDGQTVSALLDVDIITSDQVAFSAPASLILGLVGEDFGSQLGLTGTVVLTVER